MVYQHIPRKAISCPCKWTSTWLTHRSSFFFDAQPSKISLALIPPPLFNDGYGIKVRATPTICTVYRKRLPHAVDRRVQSCSLFVRFMHLPVCPMYARSQVWGILEKTNTGQCTYCFFMFYWTCLLFPTLVCNSGRSCGNFDGAENTT